MIHFTTSLKKRSAWHFKTCGGGGLMLGLAAAAGGWIILTDPDGKEIRFNYGGAGAGVGLKLPKIPDLKISTPKGKLSGVGSPSSFKSLGEILITSSFSGNELKRQDIQGLCAFIEGGGGLIIGGYGTAMLLGLDPWLAMFATMPFGMSIFLNSAKAILLMTGINAGLQAGAGIAGYFGYLH